MPGSGDDRLYIYLKSPGETFYFFGFKQGILNIASSSPRFMESLELAEGQGALAEDARRRTVRGGTGQYGDGQLICVPRERSAVWALTHEGLLR